MKTFQSIGVAIVLSYLGPPCTVVAKQESKTPPTEHTEGVTEKEMADRMRALLQGTQSLPPEEGVPEPKYDSEKTSPLPNAPAPDADAATRDQYFAAFRAYYTSYGAGLTHRQRAFEWQLFSSKLIFAAVLSW